MQGKSIIQLKNMYNMDDSNFFPEIKFKFLLY